MVSGVFHVWPISVWPRPEWVTVRDMEMGRKAGSFSVSVKMARASNLERISGEMSCFVGCLSGGGGFDIDMLV